MSESNTAVAVVDRGTSMPLAQVVANSSDRIAAIGSLGKWLAESCLIKGVDRPAAGALVAMVCMEEGISIAGFMRTYDITTTSNGCSIRKKAHSCGADFRRKGGKITWINLGEDGLKATALFEFEGQSIEISYTIEQAKKAGLIRAGGAWETQTPAMLRKTVEQTGSTILCPEILAGDDSDDAPMPVQQVRNITPAAEALVDLGNKTTLSTPTVATTVQPPKPKVIDAEVVTPKPTTPTPSPIVSRNVTPPPTSTTAASRLTDQQQEALIEAVGGQDYVNNFVLWARSQKWLGPEQLPEEMEWKYANAVIKRPEYTREKVAAFVAAGGAK